MRYLGVDPGFFGAVAALDDQGRVLEVAATPLLRIDDRNTYDVDRIRTLLWRLMACRPDRSPEVFVAIERLQAFPRVFRGAGDSAMGEETKRVDPKATFNLGLGLGVWTAAFAMFGVPRETRLLVRPQAWQKVQLAGAKEETTKAKSIAQARRLWPAVSLLASPRHRTESDGFADALHIAQYGRMVHKGGPVFAALTATGGRTRNDDVFRRA